MDAVRTFRDRQCWTPLVPQNIETDRPVRIDVRVVNLRREADLGRLERVIGREDNCQKEHAARVW